MGIFLGFLPFVAFAVLNGRLGATDALLAGAAVSAALIVRGWRSGVSPKVLEVGTLILFLAVALYAATAGGALSATGVQLCVNGGLFAIVLVSLLLRRPFTLQYAREQVPQAYWDNPAFLRTNYVITTGWALAFLVMTVAEAAMLYVPTLPRATEEIVIVAALAGAIGFTNWYAGTRRRAALAMQSNLGDPPGR